MCLPRAKQCICCSRQQAAGTKHLTTVMGQEGRWNTAGECKACLQTLSCCEHLCAPSPLALQDDTHALQQRAGGAAALSPYTQLHLCWSSMLSVLWCSQYAAGFCRDTSGSGNGLAGAQRALAESGVGTKIHHNPYCRLGADGSDACVRLVTGQRTVPVQFTDGGASSYRMQSDTLQFCRSCLSSHLW